MMFLMLNYRNCLLCGIYWIEWLFCWYIVTLLFFVVTLLFPINSNSNSIIILVVLLWCGIECCFSSCSKWSPLLFLSNYYFIPQEEELFPIGLNVPPVTLLFQETTIFSDHFYFLLLNWKKNFPDFTIREEKLFHWIELLEETNNTWNNRSCSFI